jgi:carbon monoxide dehydrogenase subunit G
MAGFTITRHIEAPREKVFERLSDFRRAPERIKGIKKVEMLTDGPVGVGTRFKETRIVFKREASEVMEVTAFNPPTGYTICCATCGCRYETEFRLTPRGTGTDVELRLSVQPLTLIAKVMGFLMRPMFKMCLAETTKDLDDIKASIEGDARPAGVG